MPLAAPAGRVEAEAAKAPLAPKAAVLLKALPSSPCRSQPGETPIEELRPKQPRGRRGARRPCTPTSWEQNEGLGAFEHNACWHRSGCTNTSHRPHHGHAIRAHMRFGLQSKRPQHSGPSQLSTCYTAKRAAEAATVLPAIAGNNPQRHKQECECARTLHGMERECQQ